MMVHSQSWKLCSNCFLYVNENHCCSDEGPARGENPFISNIINTFNEFQLQVSNFDQCECREDFRAHVLYAVQFSLKFEL